MREVGTPVMPTVLIGGTDGGVLKFFGNGPLPPHSGGGCRGASRTAFPDVATVRHVATRPSSTGFELDPGTG